MKQHSQFMYKKGQLFGQPFVYFFAIIVIGLLIIFGIKVVKDITGLAGEVEIISFFNNIDKEVQTCRSWNYGTTCSLKKLRYPKGVNMICFVGNIIEEDLDSVPNSIMRDRIRVAFSLEDDDNVFLSTLSSGKMLDRDSIKIDNLIIDKIQCFRNLNGRLEITLENRGNEVAIIG